MSYLCVYFFGGIQNLGCRIIGTSEYIKYKIKMKEKGRGVTDQKKVNDIKRKEEKITNHSLLTTMSIKKCP